MNIFVTDPDPATAARHLDDMRVNKMITESLQMLAAAMFRNGAASIDLPFNKKGDPFSISHSKHPCTLWAGDSRENFVWLFEYTCHLCAEWYKRTGKVQHGESNLAYIAPFMEHMPSNGLTPFVNCTTHHKHIPDVHDAYKQELLYKWANKKPKYKQTWYGQINFPGF